MINKTNTRIKTKAFWKNSFVNYVLKNMKSTLGLHLRSTYVVVTPSFKAKTKCISLYVPGSSFTYKVTNSEISSITNVYNIEF
jgi:hypothetical protein